MRIQSARIRNFRTLKDVSVTFDSITTFIGPNGTGKSTVLRALDWFFNGKVGMLTEKDCAFGATDEEIEVQVTFCDLTDNDRSELGKYAPAGTSTFTAWKIRRPDGAEFTSANAKGYPDFNEIKSASSATEKKGLYADLRRAQPSLGLTAASTATAIDSAMTAWESTHVELLVDAPEGLPTNFFGFNSGGKMSGLFDFVLVTADLRASEESMDGKVSIIGRILERSVDRAAADEAIAEIVEDSRARQQIVYLEKFESQLAEVRARLDEVVARYSPGRQISVRPAEVELKAPRTSFDVSVVDGTTETAVERQGHGFQRTLLISALQVLAESGAAATDGVICMAIEEPELFQHPIQAQTFAKVLRALADDPTKRIQIAYATHSPYFVEARHFDQVRRLVRSTEEPPVVTVHSATVTDVKSKLAGAVKPAVVDRQLDSTATGTLAIALFASRALLVEGTTEAAVLYGVGDKRAVGALESRGIAIVPVSGKTSLPLAHAILTEIGIPTYAMFDGDSGFESRSRAHGKTQEKIDEERTVHVTANRMLLTYFGHPEVDFPQEAILDNVAILDDHLESFLERTWPEWSAACSKVEADAGITLAKNQLAYRTATIEAEGDVPDLLSLVLLKAEGL
ncbi:Predicted ATP-dependent endonuclease of the OLD family, contains P-loop ATPase and TOPRIM domains [Agreia bicolorata]|uniref:Predicted ATP-dependent endonuclease of the OLD family, contains P-loop ATPase and TOPRIM domains n=1 Tax=Agreia bicolorata TaxID=110935 RepID=A0A1T4Y203_9MICO|nr:AAA family ATPase [Agreia bicolorata]SKA95796.1 Predicted ATP-dependent endonuclease of the OLD family, contains P-loop ATPase and TOPRIM domains [Agreia bicolorata]